jgi:hypothetical protein
MVIVFRIMLTFKASYHGDCVPQYAHIMFTFKASYHGDYVPYYAHLQG